MSGAQERVVALVLAAVLAAVFALVWLTGALAGLIFCGSPTNTPWVDALMVATRMPTHLGDPRLAWPASLRSGLPGPAGM